MSADVIEDYAYPANDAQAMRNEFIIEMSGKKSLGFPLFMSESPARLHRTAPWPGQHSDEVLGGRLGYSEDEVVQLQAAGVVA